MLLADPIHLPALKQGVTTYIIGPGRQLVRPGGPATIDYMRRYTAGFNGNPARKWSPTGNDRRISRPVRPDHGAERRLPDPQRQRPDGGHGPRSAPRRRTTSSGRCRRSSGRGWRPGPSGSRPGLDYIPSRYADAREIAALCAVIAPDDGVYVTHMRGYGPRAPEGMAEVYEIARSANVAGPHLALQRPGRPLAPPDRPGARAGPGPDLSTPIPTWPAARSWAWWRYRPGSRPAGSSRRSSAWPIRPSAPGSTPSGSRRPTPYPLDTTTIAMVADPDWRWAEGMTVTSGRRSRRAWRRATSSARSCSPREWPWASSASAPATGPRPTSGRSSGTPPTWRAPTASSAAASPTRAAGAPSPAISATTPAQLGDYYLARGRHRTSPPTPRAGSASTTAACSAPATSPISPSSTPPP